MREGSEDGPFGWGCPWTLGVRRSEPSGRTPPSAAGQPGRARGVQARFRDLAVTRTDLLVGAALTRYPLQGMWAWDEDDTNGDTYLRIEGPAVALLRKVRHRRDATLPLAMRAWAQTLNLHARGNHQPGMWA